MNKAIIMGRLTKDVDIRNADTDKKVARGTLAVNRNYKKEGEEQAADFINLVAFGKQADFLEKFGKKGIKFIVTGRIQTGSYDKDGTKIYTTDVVVEQLEFAESKSASEKAEVGTDDGFSNVPEGFEEGLPFN
ncbi:single-stranded DNA-binding protein [Butyrivibrio sp. YAB3001]|uniref:single-stranded DNA-binding protein n=1 Tax=Butyrivibrio sp. YAB3001 TaxID=1520812 RepID=UPI0008F64F31|nr:single-stranded DNA-binding protein [Butyrivibrio sp. YAB3001]SFC69268.1 single-strand DNA-binding protein [Butyrivibrio sp. YAB3001]